MLKFLTILKFSILNILINFFFFFFIEILTSKMKKKKNIIKFGNDHITLIENLFFFRKGKLLFTFLYNRLNNN